MEFERGKVGKNSASGVAMSQAAKDSVRAKVTLR
jgi:hypothetical protein